MGTLGGARFGGDTGDSQWSPVIGGTLGTHDLGGITPQLSLLCQGHSSRLGHTYAGWPEISQGHY